VLPVAMLQTGDLFTGLLTVAGATVLIMLVALCITQFTRRQAAAGGLHSFAFQGLGTPAALATGVAILVKFLGSAALTLYGGCRAITLLLAHVGVDAGGPVGQAVVVGLVTAVVLAVLVCGARVGAIAILAVELCSLLFIVGLSVLPAAGSVSLQPTGTAHGVLYLALAAIFSLAGFESATFFGPEAKRPMVTVTRTVLLTPMLCGALFVLAAWAAWTGHSATLINAYLYGTASGVPAPLVVALELGVCCSWLASATASSHAASRLVYSLGVERLLPARLAHVHARFRTPHAAIVTIVAAVAAGALVLAAGDLLDDVLRHVVRAMVVTAYVLVSVASVRFLLRIREHTPGVLVAGVLGAVAGVALLGYLLVAVVLDGRIGTAVVIVALLAAGPLWQRYLRRRPARLDAVGAFDCAESADVLPGAGAFAADAAGNVVLVTARKS
jgi:amino acid transporter